MSRKREIFLLVPILLIAVFLSSYCLKASPPFWFDEGTFYQVVNNLAFQGVLGVQIAPGIFNDLSLIALGYPVFYPAALVFRLFGASLLVERGIAIFFLLALIVACYFLVRKWYGACAALITLVLIITFAPLYGNGKSFLGEVPGLFFLVIGLLTLTHLPAPEGVADGGQAYLPRASKKNFWLSLFTGILLGMAVSIKPSYLPLLPALAVGLAVNWRVFFTNRKGWETIIAGMVGLSTALLVWVLTQFGASASVARTFSHYSNPYYLSDWLPVIILNLKRFFTESTPLHCLLLFVITTLLLARRFWKKEAVNAAEMTVFVFIVLTLIAYLRTVGWYRYFFPAHFLLFLFVVPAVESIFDVLKFKKWRKFLFILFFLVLISAQLLPLSENTLSCKVDGLNAVEPYLANLDPKERILFYSLPPLAALYSRFDFYQYIKMSEQLQLGKENLILLEHNFFTVVFIEERQQEKLSQYKGYHLEKSVQGISIYRRNF